MFDENTLMLGKSHSCLLDLGRTRPKSSEFKIEDGNEIARTGKTSILTSSRNNSLDITPVIERFNIFIQLSIDQERIDNSDNPLVVTVPFEEFLRWGGFNKTKDQHKSQRKQLNKILKVLLSKSIAYDSEEFIPYLDNAVVENGEVIVTINPKFKQAFLSNKFAKHQGNGSFIFAAPYRMGQIRPNHNHLVWSSYCKLFSQSNSNSGDRNSNIISVSKLLDYLPVSQNIQNMRKTYLLIEPMENALNELKQQNILDWDYCLKKREPLHSFQQTLRLNENGDEIPFPWQAAKDLYIYWNWTDDSLINYFDNHKIKRDEVKVIKLESKKAKEVEAEKSKKRIQKKTEDKIATERANKHKKDQDKQEGGSRSVTTPV